LRKAFNCHGDFIIVTAAVIILTQKDYKRLLAYSSIEHMGIIAGRIGHFYAVINFWRIISHDKSFVYKIDVVFGIRSKLQKYDTKQISKIKGVFKDLPVSATVFLLGLFAIAGTPPFSVFCK
jgi:hydrogenase-4 component F